MSEHLDELIERLEKAQGPDRGIDGLIARDVLGWLPYFDLEGDELLDWPDFGGHWHLPGDPCDGRHPISASRNPHPPRFTASIDAALTLVPALPLWSRLTFEKTGASWGCFLGAIDTNAMTPAISLCIAALRARQAGTSHD